jgi:hypothetical protein
VQLPTKREKGRPKKKGMEQEENRGRGSLADSMAKTVDGWKIAGK